MKFISLISCFLFSVAVAHAEEFRLLKHEEFMKLTKEQQIAYAKELSKRMGVKSNKAPRRTSYNHPSQLQMIVADILGLPMAVAEDDDGAALQKQFEEASKAGPVDLNQRARLEGKKDQLDALSRANEQKLQTLRDAAAKLQKQMSINTTDIQSASQQIDALQEENHSLNQSQSDESQRITNNNNKIEVLNQRLLILREHDKKLKADIDKVSDQVLNSSLKSGTLPNELKEIQSKIEAMDKQIQKRDEALRRQADLNTKIAADEEKIAALKKQLDKVQAQNERTEAEIEKTDDPDLKKELRNELQINSSAATDLEKKIKSLSKDRDAKSNIKDTVVSTLNPKNDGPSGKLRSIEAEATVDLGKGSNTPLKVPDKQKAAMQKICSQAKIPQEYEAYCNPSAKPVARAAENAKSKVKDANNVKTGSTGISADAKNGKLTAKEIVDYCPTAGFIVGLDEKSQDAPCPTIQSVKDDNYIGKLKGIAADAACPSQPTYGVEQKAICHPLIFGLTKDNQAICVSLVGDRSARCAAEAKAKDTAAKTAEVIKENPEAYKAWVEAYNKMCATQKTKNPARLADTEATCEVFKTQHESVRPDKKKADTPAAAK